MNLLKSTNILFIGNLIKAIVQAIYYFILAKFLSINDFGSFTYIISVTTILSSLEAFGLGNFYLMQRSRNVWSDSYIKQISILYIVIGIILCTVSMIILFLISDMNFITSLLFSLSDLILYSISSFYNQHFQSTGKFIYISIVNISYGILRLLSLVILIFSYSKILTVDNWSYAYFFGSFIAFYISRLLMIKTYSQKEYEDKKANISLMNLLENIKESYHFSLSRLSSATGSELDKIILSNQIGMDTLGVYGLAMRIINLVNMPILSLFNVTFPYFFKIGSKGIKEALTFGLKIILPIFMYIFISMIVFQFVEKYLINIFPVYKSSFDILPILLFYPLARTLKTVFADTLTGAGYQRERALIQLVMLFVTIVLQLILIPLYGLIGVIISLLTTEMITTLIFMVITFIKVKLENEHINS